MIIGINKDIYFSNPDYTILLLTEWIAEKRPWMAVEAQRQLKIL